MTKKNWVVFPVMLMILVGLAFATVFSCGSGGEDKKQEETPVTEEKSGGWTWALSDDANTNEQKGAKQSVFPPGGDSRITNAVEDPVEKDPKGNPVKRPFVYPDGEAKDDDGNPIKEKVFNFKGNTKVIKDNRGPNEGARFPMVGWEAVPDEETLELLKTAYSYSFYVRLNSATANKWAYCTAVVTDFAPEEGYEYKHWFGNDVGASDGSPNENLTPKLKLNEWNKITVVMDKNNANFNMDQDGYIYQYNPELKGPFNQDKAQKIQWQIQLQHQKSGTGVADRGATPYDIIKGSYDFDVDFYGLTLNVAE